MKKLTELRLFIVLGICTAFLVWFLLLINELVARYYTDDYGTLNGIVSKCVSIALFAILGSSLCCCYYSRAYRHITGIFIVIISILMVLGLVEGSGLPNDLKTAETIFCIVLINTLTQCLFY
jgi:hypothetical protein